MDHIIEVMFSENEIIKRISALGKSISKYYNQSDNNIILIGLLRGSFVFIADLCRNISIPHEVDFMTVSSYENNVHSNGKLRIIKDIHEDIKGKDVLIIEDIIDSGNTLNKVLKFLSLKGPKSLSICVLLNKLDHRKININTEWIGFTISNEFVVGYGIDYAQKYRYLPYIGKLIYKY